MNNSSEIVFIHGMYLTGESFAPWIERAAAAGLAGTAPSWPYHDGDPAALRAALDPSLGRLTFGAVVAHYRRLIADLPERPFLVGHSIGGLVVQKLVNEGLARAAVAISSAPARGILSLSPHFLRANFPHLNPLAGNRPVIMTPARFRYAFGNTMTSRDSDAMFERYAVPESRNVPRSTLTGQGKIDFRKSHAPLLFVTGDRDRLTPLDAVRRNARAYRRSGEEVDLQVFEGRCHAICNQDGWTEVADRAFAFLRSA
ncbi:MAG: alpha/beta hydrolase [Nocardioides sp.]